MPPDSDWYKCMVAVWMFTVSGTYQVWVRGQGWPAKDHNLGFLGQVSIHFPLFHHTQYAFCCQHAAVWVVIGRDLYWPLKVRIELGRWL